MNIGDKVRLLHGTESGRIIRFKDNDIVEIEIEDGFVIPVVRKEIVVIAEEERKRFRTTEPTLDTSTQKTFKPIVEGIFLAYVPSGNKNFRLALVNSSDYEVLFSISSVQENEYAGLFSGKAAPRSAIDLGEKFIGWIELYTRMHVEIIFHNLLPSLLKQTEQKEFRIQPAKLLSQQKNIPLLEKQGFFVQLDQGNPPIDAEALRERLSGDMPKTGPQSKNQPQKPHADTAVIDLHVESLEGVGHGMKNNEIFELQVKAFEKALEPGCGKQRYKPESNPRHWQWGFAHIHPQIPQPK